MARAANALVLRLIGRAYALMILAYPRAFRRDFGRDMYLTFRSEADELSSTAGLWSLFPFFLRVLSDWFITLWKEHFEMPKRLITVVTILSLLAVDWLTFHDLFEPHSVRDYLTLAASLLVFLYIALDVLPKRNAIAPRHPFS
jgi:hypothetical protein